MDRLDINNIYEIYRCLKEISISIEEEALKEVPNKVCFQIGYCFGIASKLKQSADKLMSQNKNPLFGLPSTKNGGDQTHSF